MSKMKIMEEIADVQVSSIIEILYESIAWAMDGVEEFNDLDSEAYNQVHDAIPPCNRPIINRKCNFWNI